MEYTKFKSKLETEEDEEELESSEYEESEGEGAEEEEQLHGPNYFDDKHKLKREEIEKLRDKTRENIKRKKEKEQKEEEERRKKENQRIKEELKKWNNSGVKKKFGKKFVSADELKVKHEAGAERYRNARLRTEAELEQLRFERYGDIGDGWNKDQKIKRREIKQNKDKLKAVIQAHKKKVISPKYKALRKEEKSLEKIEEKIKKLTNEIEQLRFSFNRYKFRLEGYKLEEMRGLGDFVEINFTRRVDEKFKKQLKTDAKNWRDKLKWQKAYFNRINEAIKTKELSTKKKINKKMSKKIDLIRKKRQLLEKINLATRQYNYRLGQGIRHEKALRNLGEITTTSKFGGRLITPRQRKLMKEKQSYWKWTH